MKKVWKWVIGIVIGLVVIAALVGVGFLVFSGFHSVRFQNGYARGWPQQGSGIMPFGGHMRGPGMMGRGWLMPFGGFIGGLFSLGFLALVVLGIIWLVSYLRKPNHVDASAAVTPAVTSPASVDAPSAMPETSMTTCKKCGKPIQADWKNCPYCGKKV